VEGEEKLHKKENNRREQRKVQEICGEEGQIGRGESFEIEKCEKDEEFFESGGR
jgi:hypothetical protein